MIKIAIVVCLAALAAAEADADAWYGPYGYNNNWMGYGNNWPMMSGYRQMNYMNGHEGHRFQSYGKREAEAEPEADADAWYQPYGYSNWNNNWMGYNNWPMNYNNWNMYNNMYNRPSFTQYRTFYHKRSADAEADADAWYQPYGYSHSNWGYNRMHGYNMMSYWNRPYSQFSSYRYHY